MLLVYSDTITPRLEYISSFIGNEIFGAPFPVTNDKRAFQSFRGPKINYSANAIEGSSFHIVPVPLLFEAGVETQRISCFEWQLQKAFFPTQGDFAFDVFAACFYLLSRYEEYQFKEFDHRESLAFREHFLQTPIINLWLNELAASLRSKFNLPELRPKTVQHLVTYQVDPVRQASITTSEEEPRTIWKRVRSLFTPEKEETVVKQPDVFEWLDALHLYCRLKPVYLFRLSSWLESSEEVSPESLRQLVNYSSLSYPVGACIERGDESQIRFNESTEWFEVVAELPLDHLLAEGVTVSELNTLAKSNIDHVYTMNYESVNGFRAGTCSPFKWYDLSEETATDSWIYPIIVSDNATKQSAIDAAAFYNELVALYNAVKSARGVFVTNWKIALFKDPALEQPWEKMFELFMRETVYWDDSFVTA